MLAFEANVTQIQVFTYFVSYWTSGIYSTFAMFMVGYIGAFGTIIGLFFLPESPYFLIEKKKFDETREVLMTIAAANRRVDYMAHIPKIIFETEQLLKQKEAATFNDEQNKSNYSNDSGDCLILNDPDAVVMTNNFMQMF